MAKVIPYGRVYGVMGVIPLAVFWIFITWMIVLFGLQLTFATQHLDTLEAAEKAAKEKRAEYFLANDITIANIVVEIFKAFEKRKTPLSAEYICSQTDLPTDFGEKILHHLVEQELRIKAA